MSALRVLIATNMYPSAEAPWYGIFVKELVDELRRQGMDVDVSLHNGRASRWNYLKGVFEIRKQLRRKKYDVIHVQHTYSMLVVWLARLLAGVRVPVVWTFHDGEIFRTTKNYEGQDALERLKYVGGIKKWAVRRADFMIPVQRDMLRVLMGNEEKTVRYRVIPAGIILARFAGIDRAAARRKLGHGDNEKVVFFPASTGRAEKRFDLAQGAVEKLRGEGIALKFYAAGNIPYDDMPLHLTAADVVVVCSDYEASPLVVREAFACETPVVATRVGDVEEYRELAGLVLCEADVGAIAEGIGKVLNVPRPYGGLALNKARGLDQADIARKTLEVYREVLRLPQKGAAGAKSLQ